MTISNIIKLAIKRLERENKLLTPDFYTIAFCEEAKKAGVKVEDCNHIQNLSSLLDNKLQKELKNYRIKTISEFARFLIAKLNRTNQAKVAELLDAQTEMTKSILTAITYLHNLEATELAKKTLELLNSNPTKAELDNFKQMWQNFISTYDDTFLLKLKKLGDIDTKDLQKSIENLNIESQKEQQKNSNELNLEKISSLLISSFSPSIASNSGKNILEVSKRLKQDPSLLSDENFSKEIQEAISLRIALDKKSVNNMIKSLENVLDRLSKRIISMMEKSDGSSTEIKKIRCELEELKNKENELDFKITHKQLYTIAIALEEDVISFRKDLITHQDDVSVLQKKIKELEKELKKAKEEAKTDFLTKLYNKRALDEFLRIKEGEFERYKRNYSLVMFDLDHFKKINDTYGHEAGDAVLSAFAKILKKDSRDVDVVGRYGGEEFLAILSDTNLDGGAIYAEKVRKHVEKAKFMYKGERIFVTVSCGVSEREHHPSMNMALKTADENLYKAKNTGRNKVVAK